MQYKALMWCLIILNHLGVSWIHAFPLCLVNRKVGIHYFCNGEHFNTINYNFRK